MNSHSCKCGETQYFESGMYPKDCQGCDKCGTTITRPHKPKAHHNWRVKYCQNTGYPKYRQCGQCYKLEKLEPTLEARIEATPGEKVTKESMLAKITKVEYTVIGLLTICVITVENGFTFTGESACVDPTNFRKDIGEEIAYNNAFNKIWAFEGYLLAERRFRA